MIGSFQVDLADEERVVDATAYRLYAATVIDEDSHMMAYTDSSRR